MSDAVSALVCHSPSCVCVYSICVCVCVCMYDTYIHTYMYTQTYAQTRLCSMQSLFSFAILPAANACVGFVCAWHIHINSNIHVYTYIWFVRVGHIEPKCFLDNHTRHLVMNTLLKKSSLVIITAKTYIYAYIYIYTHTHKTYMTGDVKQQTYTYARMHACI